MARTLEAAAPATLTSFHVEVIAGGVVVETIAMVNIVAERVTWQGVIANALSTGFCKLNFIYNDAATPSARYYANISPDDGTISYARDFVYSDMVVNSAPGSTGGGARTILITVTDGVIDLEGATVRLSKAAESFVGETNVDGEITFNINDGTWIVAIALFGYTFPGATLVVSGDTAVEYILIPVGSIVPPTTPGFCSLRIRVWDDDGSVAQGISVSVRVDHEPLGFGEVFDKSKITKQTAADGYATFTVPRGSRIKYSIPGGEEKSDDIPLDQDIVYVENYLGIVTV